MQDYLPEQLPHVPEQVSLREKISRLIERAGAETVMAALTSERGEAPADAPLTDAALVGRPPESSSGGRRNWSV